MGQAIVITSGKGGAGKTTAAANIGACLAKDGKKVIIVDADIGLRSLDIALNMQDMIIYDLVDVVEGICDLEQAVRPVRENLDMLPAAQMRDKTAVSPEQMAEIIERLRPEYSFILIDCPAGIGHGFRTAVSAADEALLVTLPEYVAVRDAERILGLIKIIGLPTPRLLINRYRGELAARGESLSAGEIEERLRLPLIGRIPESPALLKHAFHGELICDFPEEEAGQAYLDTAARFLGKSIPYPEYKRPGFFHALRLFLAQWREGKK